MALKECSPKTVSCAFYQKKALWKKQGDLGDMFRKVSKSVCTTVIVVAPDPIPVF
jgi:hypothetical protein